MSYKPRIAESSIETALEVSGAVFIRGVKASGKTETAKRFTKSGVNLQSNPEIRMLAEISPETILAGDTPRLIDEWQEVASIWNNVKIEVDDRKSTGQFILTGSSTLDDSGKFHSGAGRIITINLSTLTWSELGHSNASVSLGSLLLGEAVSPIQKKTSLKSILERLVIGGWPALINKDESDAVIVNRSYVDLLLSDDISRVSGIKRDKKKAESVVRSIARNIATAVEISTITSDSENNNSATKVSRQATYDYLGDLTKLMIVVDQPAWNVHIRSSALLRTTPKRHLADPSLACAVLGLSSQSLLQDLRYSGFLFESQVFHNLSVYAAENDAKVLYYRDSLGNEVDMIVEKRDGSWAAFEVKLGHVNLDDAANKLLSFAQNIDKTKSKAPGSLNIITGTGLAYTRPDGVNILPLSVLGV